jgi:hypothetical protein
MLVALIITSLCLTVIVFATGVNSMEVGVAVLLVIGLIFYYITVFLQTRLYCKNKGNAE